MNTRKHFTVQRLLGWKKLRNANTKYKITSISINHKIISSLDHKHFLDAQNTLNDETLLSIRYKSNESHFLKDRAWLSWGLIAIAGGWGKPTGQPRELAGTSPQSGNEHFKTGQTGKFKILNIKVHTHQGSTVFSPVMQVQVIAQSLQPSFDWMHTHWKWCFQRPKDRRSAQTELPGDTRRQQNCGQCQNFLCMLARFQPSQLWH
jgi:hypothetical protein